MDVSLAKRDANERSRIRFTFGVTTSMVAGLLVGALLVVLLATRFFGFHVLVVQSNSMNPALHRGDLIVTRPVAIGDVDRGQVILFRDGESSDVLVAHRVVGIIDETVNATSRSTGQTTQHHSQLLRTKGDANTVEDPTAVNSARLSGVLWFSVPGAGALMSGWHLQQFLIGMALLSAALWVAYEVRRLMHRRLNVAGLVEGE